MRSTVARTARCITKSHRPSRNLSLPPTSTTSSRRYLQINAANQPSTPTLDTLPLTDSSTSSTSLTPPTPGTSPDARFEVLGPASSLLSISLTASQNLYTRRGSLVGVSGSPDDAVSSLSPLSPLVRAPLGIPFLYQKIASTTPVNLLIATRTQHTNFSVIHLDGRIDWVVTQRKGLVAWTGHTLVVKPAVNLKMSLAHWGNTIVTGRGLVALAGPGQIYQITLNKDEEYVAHPSNVLAYTMTEKQPMPYRFKSRTLRLQIPNIDLGIGRLISRSKFLKAMATTQTWKFVTGFMYTLRRWGRSTILGDRLFLHFRGPTTILLQSRGSNLRDSLTSRDIDEIADAPAGVLYGGKPKATNTGSGSGSGSKSGSGASPDGTEGQPQRQMRLSYATVDKGRRVTFGKE